MTKDRNLKKMSGVLNEYKHKKHIYRKQIYIPLKTKIYIHSLYQIFLGRQTLATRPLPPAPPFARINLPQKAQMTEP